MANSSSLNKEDETMARHNIDWNEILAAIPDKEAARAEADEHFTQLVLPLLSDAQLQFLIEESQHALDQRYPPNKTDLRCPKCGQTEVFRVEVYQFADVHADGAEVDIDADPAWGAESACNCQECEYAGRVRDFQNL